MAKKVQPVNISPAPSSSEDETQDKDSSSTATDDEPVSKPEPVVKKPSLQEPQESEESDDDSDSDETRNPRVKSSAKRPEETDKAVSKNQQPGKVNGGNSKRHLEVEKVENVEKTKKSKVSNGEGQSVGKVKKGSKCKVSNGEGQSVGIVKSGSKSKKGTSGDVESGQVEEKKSLVKWSEEDAVKLLHGIFNYKAETGEDVNSNVNAFYEYVKDSFSVDLTKIQVYEKIRSLKKKFKTNVDKWKTGEEPVFSKPHDRELFELSKKIWGSEVTVTDGNDRNDVENEEETEDFSLLYPWLCASIESEAAVYLKLSVEDLEEYVKWIISWMGKEKARELEDEWKAFHVMYHQLYARRAHLISKQAQIVTDLFKQS